MKANKLLLAARHRAELHVPSEGELPSLGGATAWLNSPPLTAASLRGHVVLIDFWTYTCINWLRTLPYVRAWAEKYREYGVMTIGVHAPEFSFEHDLENVRRAARDMRVNYPIAIDNDFAIWHAFTNHYWPALYLVDALGHLRYHHFGEGAYELTEMMLQHVLAEAGVSGFDDDLVSVETQGAEVAADWGSLRSVETYVGFERTERFRVFLDGQALGEAFGSDVDEQGHGTVSEQRLYQLIRQPGPIADRQFEIEFLEAGVAAFVFTFG
jgi:thiol-disulfide isomerase/thioredoxin